MIHDSTWLGSMRAKRRSSLTAPIGLLLACVLLAALPAVASATTPDVRGEWALTVTSAAGTLHGKALISQEANAQGEFEAHSVFFENVIPGTFKGTLEGATATVETTSSEFGPVPAGKFKSKTMAVETAGGSLSLHGEGELKLGTQEMPATETLTRIKTQHQIEEQEAQERREQEERAARANVRGEWALTLESGPTVLKGRALIREEANAKNEFASSNALFESIVPGTFSGKLEGSKATVTITTQAVGPAPAGTFTSSTIAVVTTNGSFSMSGSGVFKAGEAEFPSMLTATRIKSYAEVVEREIAEQEAKETQEREAVEKAALELKEKELKERQQREAREAAEKAAIKPAPVIPSTVTPPVIPTLVSVLLSSKAPALSHSGVLPFSLTNPNGSAVTGHLKLALAKTGKASSAKRGAGGTLGEGSFSISAHGTTVVKIKLSQSGRTQLARHKTLRIVVTLTTQTSGAPSAVAKSYSITLHSPAAAHHKG